MNINPVAIRGGNSEHVAQQTAVSGFLTQANSLSGFSRYRVTAITLQNAALHLFCEFR